MSEIAGFQHLKSEARREWPGTASAICFANGRRQGTMAKSGSGTLLRPWTGLEAENHQTDGLARRGLGRPDNGCNHRRPAHHSRLPPGAMS